MFTFLVLCYLIFNNFDSDYLINIVENNNDYQNTETNEITDLSENYSDFDDENYEYLSDDDKEDLDDDNYYLSDEEEDYPNLWNWYNYFN